MLNKLFIKYIFFTAAILFTSGGLAFSSAADSPVKLPISIFVSIGAHLDFCQRIGADRVSVKLALAPGKSPATYAPSPREIIQLSRARLYFKLGLPFETVLLKKIKALPHTPEIINTQSGIKLQPMGKKIAERHKSTFLRHTDQTEGLDPHTWLDPRLALKQATTIYQTLIRVDPDGKKLYNENYNRLKEELESLYSTLNKTFAPFKGRTIFVYHPAFGYFARAFGLHQVAIELAGKKPKARDLANFIKSAQAAKISALFVQPQFDQQSADKVAGILGCAVIKIDPLATHYCQNLQSMAAAIQENTRIKAGIIDN